MKSLQSQTFYEVLGISRYASPEEIRNAYELSKLTFTENSVATYSLFSKEENHEILDLVSRAYETLLNPDMRREYDTFLDHREKGAGRSWEEWEAMARAKSSKSRGLAAPEKKSRTAPARTEGAPRAGNGGGGTTNPDAEEQKSDIDEFIKSVEFYSGAVLKKVREKRGLSVVELANLTKIRITYIGYIEEENYEGLPAAVYVKGFVRLIATAISLPEDQVAHDYMSTYRSKMDKPNP